MLMHVMPWAFAGLLLAMLLNFWRLLRGPDAVDRALALDTLYLNAIALVVLAGIRLNDKSYFEAGLLIALMGFVATVALARFLSHGRVLR
ncbi:MAG: sodium hydrogen antiporter subunitF, ShaF [Pseudomonadota bacterium]|mgnify:CR=1 FL=1|jgi:multicomponent K+:H+ antiporter subunit F